MDLRDAIINRRSIKKFDHDMYIDENAVKDAIEVAAYAPNHCLREPWRVVYVSKDNLGKMSKELSSYAFPKQPDKHQSHYDAVTKLGGFLVIIEKNDPRQREENENKLGVGAFAQNLLLLLYEAGIGTCWKTPDYIFNPKVRKMFNLEDDESISGFLYLTDLEKQMPKPKRKNRGLITMFS